MKDAIVRLLSPFGDFMFTVTAAIPMWAVRVLVFAVLAALAIWVLRMRPQTPDGEDKAGKMDLRWFALLVLVLQAILYIIF